MVLYPHQVVIAGVGSYPGWTFESTIFDTIFTRGMCAIELGFRCAQMGIQLYIADYQSSEEWMHNMPIENVFLKSRDPLDTSQKAGRLLFFPELMTEWPLVQVIVWTPPENTLIVDKDTLTAMVEPVLNGDCLIALPTRKDNLSRPEEIVLETYPDYMASSELAGIAELDSLLVRLGYKKPSNVYDTYSGIVVMSKKLLRPLEALYARQQASSLKSTDEYGLLLPYLFMFLGLPVGSPTVPFRYYAPLFQNELLPSNRAYFEKRRAAKRKEIPEELLAQHAFFQTLDKKEILSWFTSL